MVKHITCASVAFLLLAAPAASAQVRTPPDAARGAAVQQRAPHFPQRIRAGVRAGQLTREEVGRIRQHLRQFRAEARRMRQDGTMTPAERTRLRHEMRQVSRQIFRLRHNK